MRRVIFLAGLLALAVSVRGQTTAPATAPATQTEGRPQAIDLKNGTSIEFLPNNIVHVFTTGMVRSHPSYAVVPQKGSVPVITLWNGQMPYCMSGALRVSPSDGGGIQVTDDQHGVVLHEVPNGRTLTPATVQGEATNTVRQEWLPSEGESLYGLGEHQYDFLDLSGHDFTLWQHNTEIAVPLLVSSKGYGIFWDNPSPTKFGDPRDFTAIPADHLLSMAGQPGGLTPSVFGDYQFSRTLEGIDPSPIPMITQSGRGDRAVQAMRWEGFVQADAEGDYQFSLYANGGYTLTIDGAVVAHHWRQNWLAGTDLVTVHFAAHSDHPLKLEWSKDQGTTCQLTWKTPNPNQNISLSSMAGDGVDYYVIYGGPAGSAGAIDKVLAGYRQLTGRAPMMPRWAFGLWQSRQRYETQQASLDVVKGFRDRQIPFDNIVQDWFYWREDNWGSHEFDPARFPDPDAWIKDIHAQHANLMISVWPKFYPTTDNAKAMAEKGFLFPLNPREKDWVGRGYAYTFYDAFQPEARKLFWQQIDQRLFSKGVDAWWMDATEPDVVQPSPATLERQLADMPGRAAVANAYPMLNAESIYDGQRAAAPNQRVFILTRSGYAGQQRYAAASWSGDITSSWTAMKKQIVAGTDYSISGMPYWTMDSGGFSVPAKWSSRNAKPEDVDEWRELNARWFEFAAFVPLLRVHGEAPFREMWQFGGEDSDAYKAMLKADKLRYRMLPYIYSLAGDVTQNDGTFMRPLVMDFPGDAWALKSTEEYMFGPAFLVTPVTQYKAREWEAYLPETKGGWYDFWTGKAEAGGAIVREAAPLDQMPLHVRAGSIVPLGPEQQYVGEKPADPLTVMVYAGADGDFSLYEDDGLTYGYERGEFSRIAIHWDDGRRVLTLGKRAGTFTGMLNQRTINVVLVSPAKAVGYTPSVTPNKTISYTGDAVELRF